MIIVGGYELIDCFIEMNAKPLNKELLLHHICASLLAILMIYNYNNSIYQPIIEGIVYCESLMISSNLFLNLQFLFPTSTIAKLIFMTVFFINRLILVFPYIRRILLGYYPHNDIISITLLSFGLFFYLLSAYWGIKILKKLQRLITKCL